MGYIVYKHTSPSGKCYIGMTCQTMDRRARGGDGYRGCSAFYNAIQKYGWDNFTHEVLVGGLSFEEACELEQRFIRLFDSLTTGHGYNLENGGRVNCRTSDETRAKISKTLTGRKRGPLSEEQKRRISEARMGIKCPPRSEEYRRKLSVAHRGKVFSEEHKRRISEGKRGTQAGANNPRARSVRCVENGIVFGTVKDAAAFVGGSPKNIIHACAGRLKTSGGYHWEYVGRCKP